MSNALQCDSESLLDQAIFETSGKSACWKRCESVFSSGILNFFLLTVVSVYLVVTILDLEKRVDTFDNRFRTLENQMLNFEMEITGAQKSIEHDKSIVENDKTVVEADKKRVEALTNAIGVQITDLERNISKLEADYVKLDASLSKLDSDYSTLQSIVSSNSLQILFSNSSIHQNENAISAHAQQIGSNAEAAKSNQEKLGIDAKLIRANLDEITKNRQNITRNFKVLEKDATKIQKNAAQGVENLGNISKLSENTTLNAYRIETNTKSVLSVHEAMASLNMSFNAHLNSIEVKEKLNGCYKRNDAISDVFYVQNEIFLQQPQNNTGYVTVAYIVGWESENMFRINFLYGTFTGVCTATAITNPKDNSRFRIALTHCGTLPHHLLVPCEDHHHHPHEVRRK